MGVELFLNLVKSSFNPDLAKALVSAFRAEPLVWKALSDENALTSFQEFAALDTRLWQPGLLAVFSLNPKLAAQDLSDPESKIPAAINNRASKTLDTIRLTGLEPSTLEEAALLALSLRGYYSLNKSWKDVYTFLSTPRGNLSLWRSAFACLPPLAPQLPELAQELARTTPLAHAAKICSLLLHSVDSTPAVENDRFQLLVNLFSGTSLDFQRECLLQLKEKESAEVLERLAASFLAASPQENASEKNIASVPSFEKVSELRKIAFLNLAAGQQEEAMQALQSAFEQLKASQALLLRDLAIELEKTDPEEARKTWEEVLSLLPEAAVYKEEYAEFLLAHGELEYALDLLEQVPSSTQKTLLLLRYPELRATLKLEKEDLQALPTRMASISRFQNESDSLKAARYAFDNKDYALADELVSKTLRISPNDLDTLKLAGQIKKHTAEIESAIQSSELVALFEPDNLTNKKDLANLFLQTRQPEKALDIYQELISANAEPSRADLLTYADIAIKAEKPDLAIPICESFISRDNLDGEALVTLCAAYIGKGDEENAITLLDQTSAIAPEKPASWLALAEIWTKLGRSEMAMESLKKAKAALPANPDILLALGKLYYENERPTEAISVLKQAFQLNQDDPEIRKSLAKAYLTHGYLNEAWSVISPLESDYTSDPDLALTLGKVMVALGDYQAPKAPLRFAWHSSKSDEALKAYANLLLMQSSHSEGNTGADNKELNQLLEAVQEKTQPDGSAFDFKVLAADIHNAQGKIETAYKAYLELLDQPDGKTPRTYFHLQHQIGLCALKLGYPDVSVSALQEAVLVDSDNLDARHTLCEAFAAADMPEESLAAAKATLQLAPTELDNVLWYSGFCSKNGNEREAVQVLKDTLYLLPDEQALYLALARAYLNMGYTAETKETLNRMLEGEDISTEEYVKVANIYLHMNESAEATRIIQQAIANNPQPDFAEGRELIYTVLRLGDGASALQLLVELEKPLGNHPCFPILKSDVLVGNKQFLPALQHLEGLLKEIEFSGADLAFESYASTALGEGIPDYTRAGVLYRAAQLERASGDLAAAQKHAGQASALQSDQSENLLLKSELAFALRKSEKLDSTLELLENNSSSQVYQDLTRLLAVNALVERDQNKTHLLLDHFLARQAPSAIFHASRAFLALPESKWSQAEEELKLAEAMLDHAYARSALESFNIQAHFTWVWEALAVAVAAFEAQAWNLADKCFRYALAEIKINPVVNQQLAEYLVEKARVANNARALRIVKHMPQPFSPEETDEQIHQEQVSIAGRFISAAEMLPTLKIGQAVFTGRWNEGEELKQLVRNSRQAAQVLSVQIDTETIKDITAAFPEDFDVAYQEAILQLFKNPAVCAQKAVNLLESQPKNPCVHAMLAIAQQADPEKAANAIEQALEIWPDEPDWHAIAGSFYENSGVYDKAAKHIEDALHILPKSAQYWQMLGDVKVQEKDYHAARDYFTKAIELFPGDPDALFSLAVINQQLGEYQAAIQCLREVESIDPGKSIYGETIAESHFAMQDYPAAEEQANRVLQLNARSSRALLVKIKALMKRRQYEEAKRVLQSARELVADPIPFDLLGIELDATAQRKTGLGAALVLAETHPDNPLVLNTLANYYLEANMQTQAEETLHHSLEIDSQNPQTLLMLGRIGRRRGNLDQALSYLTRALAVNPSLIEAYLELGQTYQDRRDSTRALETYHRAIEMVEKDPRAYIQAAAAYKDSKDYQNAESMLRQAAQFAPNDPVIRRQLASIVALNLVNNLQEAPKRR